MINYAVDEVEKIIKVLLSVTNRRTSALVRTLMILMEAQDDNYFEIELVVKNFQMQ